MEKEFMNCFIFGAKYSESFFISDSSTPNALRYTFKRDFSSAIRSLSLSKR